TALAAKLGKTVSLVNAATDKNGILVVFTDRSRAMYRASGTEPVVRIYGEETTPERLRVQEQAVQETLLELTQGPAAPGSDNNIEHTRNSLKDVKLFGIAPVLLMMPWWTGVAGLLISLAALYAVVDMPKPIWKPFFRAIRNGFGAKRRQRGDKA